MAMIQELLEKHKPQFEKASQYFQNELTSIRTGRANPAMVENLPVESYGGTAPLKNLASITVTDVRTLSIQPWDKGILSAIEKAVQSSNLNIQPVNDGTRVRLNLPPLTEERRKELVKVIKQQAETARVRIRNVREDIWREVVKLEKEKKIREDEKFEAQKKLQELIEGYNEKIKRLLEKKEQEIMTV